MMLTSPSQNHIQTKKEHCASASYEIFKILFKVKPCSKQIKYTFKSEYSRFRASVSKMWMPLQITMPLVFFKAHASRFIINTHIQLHYYLIAHFFFIIIIISNVAARWLKQCNCKCVHSKRHLSSNCHISQAIMLASLWNLSKSNLNENVQLEFHSIKYHQSINIEFCTQY